MELTSSFAPQARRSEAEMNAVSERVLLRVIDFSFGPAGPRTRPFRRTFREFVEAYFILVKEGEGLLDAPAPRPRIVAALAEILERHAGLCRLRTPSRQAAAILLASMFALADPVRRGLLSPSEGAEHVTAMLFDGLQPRKGKQHAGMDSRGGDAREQDS